MSDHEYQPEDEDFLPDEPEQGQMEVHEENEYLGLPELLDEEEDDLDDHCDECADLLDDDGTCPNVRCKSNPCHRCGLHDSCMCEPETPGERLAYNLSRKPPTLRQAAKPQGGFKTLDDFTRHLAENRRPVDRAERIERTTRLLNMKRPRV